MEKRKEEIEEQIALAEENTSVCHSDYPGASFEEGVAHALRWVLGQEELAPMTDKYNNS